MREGKRVLSHALVLALGVKEDGEREALGLEVGPTEEYAACAGVPAGLGGPGAAWGEAGGL